MSERIETVVLDSEGLSAWIAQDRRFLAMLKAFHDRGADLVIGANAIDATVAEVALRQPQPVALLASDSDDMTKLCGSQVCIIPL